MGSLPNLKKSNVELLAFLEGLKKQWMETVDAIIDPLMIIDLDYTIKKINRAAAEIQGSSSDIKFLIGKKCYEVFADRKAPCQGCRVNETSGSPLVQFQLDNVRRDFYYEVSSRQLLDEEGKISGILNIYRDRTEARRLQNQLLQHEKLASIGLLAGGVAHEINNPLGGILIFSQMLLREMDKNSPHYQDVVEIEAATQRCKAIVENLLDFARQQPKGNQEGFEAIDIRDVIVSAIRFARVGRMEANIDVIEEWPEQTLHVKGNRNKLIQLFLNLIQNAFQSMPDGGTLTICAQIRHTNGKSLLAVSVIDTGIGIASEDLKRIFDPFYTKKDPGEGTGLGLAICYGIAEEMGASIEVESVLNEGSCFQVIAPIVEPEKAIQNQFLNAQKG